MDRLSRRHGALVRRPEACAERRHGRARLAGEARDRLPLGAYRLLGRADRNRDAERRIAGAACGERCTIQDLDSGRLDRRVDEARDERLRRARVLEAREPGRLELRHGMEPERQLTQDAESSESADHELGHVVAAH